MAWHKSYRYRFKFTIDSGNIDAALTDFPVALHINGSAGTGSRDLTRVFDVVGARWNNLCVCAQNEVTPLWTEVDTWDAANETGVLHVRVPKISASSSTELCLYFDADGLGNGFIGATGSAAGQAVWDDDFLAVYHFSQDLSAGDLLDSTANGYDGTPSGFESGDTVAGQVGLAVTPDGTAEKVDSLSTSIVVTGTAERTVEFVGWPDQTGYEFPIYLGANGTRDAWALKYSPTEIAAALSNCRRGVTGTFDNTCRHIAYWYPSGQTSSTAVGMHINGEAQTVTLTAGTDGTINTATTYRSFFVDHSANYSGNKADEIRISDIQRSSAWLKATYYTLFDSLGAWASLEWIYVPGAEAPWLGSWQNRIPLTISSANIDEDLTDFPVALFLNSAAGTGTTDVTAIFDALGANSHKIAVTDHTGIRQLFVEIDTWDETGEEAVLHVKVPHVDADTDTLIYLYFDANKADNDGFVGDAGDAVAQNVWDANFVAVWHMATDPSGASAFRDSTVNAFHGSMVGTMLTEDLVAGPTGKAIDFDGSDDEFTRADNALLNVDAAKNWTCEAVVNKDEGTVRACIFDKRYAGESTGWLLGIHEDDTPHFSLNDGSDSVESAGSTAMTVDGTTWYHVAGVFDRTGTNTAMVYLNGGIDCAPVSTAAIGNCTRAYPLHVGDQGFVGSSWGSFNGKMSELRLSDTVRSAAWLKATYNTLFDTLIAWSVAETFAGTGWLRGFTYRTQVSIAATNIDASLDYFPVTLFLSSSCGTGSADMTAVFDEIGANSKKIGVTLADGKTQLPVEIDYWDDTGETAVLHVRVPSITSEETTYLYLYYSADVPDNDEFVGDTGEAPAMSVWDGSFEMVLHMGQDPSGTAPQMKDSTVNSRHGTTVGSMASGDLVSDGVGQCVEFDGSAQGVHFGDILDDIIAGSSAKFTLESWVYMAAVGSGTAGNIFSKYDSGSNNRGLYNRIAYVSITRLDFHYEDNAVDDRRSVSGSTDLSATTWYHCVSQYDATAGTGNGGADRVKLYVNGSSETLTVTDTSGSVVNMEDNAAYFGVGALFNTAGSATGAYLGGRLDEMRVSSTLRSAAWVKATYYSTNDGLIAYNTEIETEDNWLGDWAYRIQLQIDSSKVGEDLTDFPVTLFLHAASGINGQDVTAIFDNLGANNLKIAAATADGTQCYVDVERWDETAEEAVLHIKVPTVYASRDTLLYLYYDSTKSDNTDYVGDTGDTAAQAVWSSDYSTVIHMNNATALYNAVNGNAISFGGSANLSLVDGPVTGSKGLEADSADDYLDLGTIDFGNDFTIEVQYRVNSGGDATSYDQIIGSEKVVSLTGDSTITANWVCYIGGGSGWDASVFADSDPAEDTWYTIGVGKDSAAISYTKDGADDGGGAITDRNPPNATFYVFTRYNATSTYRLHGIITELRICATVAKSDPWMQATQFSLVDDMVNYGAVEAIGSDWSAFTGWYQRIPFTIPATNIDDNLTGFPVALVLGSSVGTGSDDLTAIFDAVGGNYRRVAVGAANGKPIPCEIDVWDDTAESAVLHAKAPLIEADHGAKLYLYFNDNQPDQGWVGDTGEYIAQAVWDDDFVGVYHLSQDPSGAAPQIKDSTQYGRHMTSQGSMVTGDLMASEPGEGLDFNGSSQGVYITSGPITAYPYTLEAAGPANVVAAMPTNPMVGIADASAAQQLVILHVNDGVGRLNHFATGNYIQDGTVSLVDGVFCHLAGVGVDSTNRSIFTNGGDKATDTSSAGFPTGIDTMSIGISKDSSPYYFEGEVSEARFSNVARSDAWIKATYYTLFDDLGDWGNIEYEPAGNEIEETLGKVSIVFTPNELTTEVYIEEWLAKGRVAFTARSLTATYKGNIVRMTDADGSRPRIASASCQGPGIVSASGSHPRLAAAEAFEYQERE